MEKKVKRISITKSTVLKKAYSSQQISNMRKGVKDYGDSKNGDQVNRTNGKEAIHRPQKVSNVVTRKQKQSNQTRNNKPNLLSPNYPLRSQTNDIIEQGDTSNNAHPFQVIQTSSLSPTQTKPNEPVKKRNRRNISEVNESYRCYCGKSFVSYPGIYIHLKEKHFGVDTKENMKFYLKTFKHKTNGTRIKQVVVGGEAEFGVDSVRKMNANVKRIALKDRINPIVEGSPQQTIRPKVVVVIDSDDDQDDDQTTNDREQQPSSIIQKTNIKHSATSKLLQNPQQKTNTSLSIHNSTPSLSQSINSQQHWLSNYSKLVQKYNNLVQQMMRNQKHQRQRQTRLQNLLQLKDKRIKQLQENINLLRDKLLQANRKHSKVVDMQENNLQQPAINDNRNIRNDQQQVQQFVLQQDEQQQSSIQQNSQDQKYQQLQDKDNKKLLSPLQPVLQQQSDNEIQLQGNTNNQQLQQVYSYFDNSLSDTLTPEFGWNDDCVGDDDCVGVGDGDFNNNKQQEQQQQQQQEGFDLAQEVVDRNNYNDDYDNLQLDQLQEIEIFLDNPQDQLMNDSFVKGEMLNPKQYQGKVQYYQEQENVMIVDSEKDTRVWKNQRQTNYDNTDENDCDNFDDNTHHNQQIQSKQQQPQPISDNNNIPQEGELINNKNYYYMTSKDDFSFSQ